ncbi:MAG: hypothetical protein H7835_14030 [Magnetococcus sp. XQGC-1]
MDINWLEEQWLLWAVILLLLCAVYGLLRRRRRLLARAEELSVGSRRRAQPVVVVPVAEVESTPLPIQVDDSRLPDQEPWVGRQKQFSLLDGWLADPEVGVVALLAPDGGGKSRLLRRWADGVGAEKSFFWSFQENGGHGPAGGCDLFFTQVSAAFAGETGGLLACLSRQPALLLLDGVELLSPAAISRLRQGMVDEAGRAGGWANRLLVYTSREEGGESEGGSQRLLSLEPLKENEATQLLHELGVRGKFADFRPVVKAMRGHPLLLTLVGRLVARCYQGSMGNRERLASILAPESTEGQLEQLLIHYETLLWSEPQLHILFMRLLGLFDRPVDKAELARLCQEIPLAQPLLGMEEGVHAAMVTDLQRAGLLEVSTRGFWRLHPLVQAHYGRRWLADDPEVWQQTRQR